MDTSRTEPAIEPVTVPGMNPPSLTDMPGLKKAVRRELCNLINGAFQK